MTAVLWPLDACVGRGDVGAKAETLARARAAGLPALDGVVLPDGAEVGAEELAAALERLGGDAFAVRSSAAVEDRAGASAAGVFESVIGARGVPGVTAAIARVRASAGGEPARVYLQAKGLAPSLRLAVLIQPIARAARLAVARSLDGDGGGFLVEERAAGEPEWGDVQARTVDQGALADLLRALEALVGGPVDAELAFARERTGGESAQAASEVAAPGARAPTEGAAPGAAVDAFAGALVLQARPRTGAAASSDQAFAVEGDWRLDAEHNPEPLSAAQAGLVEWIDTLGVGVRQRVLSGYLFVERGAAPRGLAPIPLAVLRARFDGELAPECHARLAAVEERGELEPALEAFAHVYRRYVGEVGPSLARARQQLDQLLRMNLGEPLAAHGALLGGLGGLTVERDQALWRLGREPASLAEYLARFGAYAPAWDVAVAPDDEAPERVLAAARRLGAEARSPVERREAAAARAVAAAHALLERLPRMARRAWKALLALAREVLPLAEDDDLLFFRAQRAVRRALVVEGRRLVAAARLDSVDQIFDLPLELVRAAGAERSGGDRPGGSGAELADEAAGAPERASRSSAAVDLRPVAGAGRAARRAAARVIPPVAIDGGHPRHAAPAAREVLRGHGTEGRARGRAVIVRALSDAPAALPPDTVLVVPALLPSLTYLLPSARALVTDHGGAASHGATLAREYGIPAVLGTGRATQLPDGADLYVDASTGRVYRID